MNARSNSLQTLVVTIVLFTAWMIPGHAYAQRTFKDRFTELFSPAARDNAGHQRMMNVLRFQGMVDERGNPNMSPQHMGTWNDMYEEAKASRGARWIDNWEEHARKQGWSDAKIRSAFWQNMIARQDRNPIAGGAFEYNFKNAVSAASIDDALKVGMSGSSGPRTVIDPSRLRSGNYSDVSIYLNQRGIDVLNEQARNGLAVGAEAYIRSLDMMFGSAQWVEWMEKKAESIKAFSDDPMASIMSALQSEAEKKITEQLEQQLKKALGEARYKEMMEKYKGAGSEFNRLVSMVDDLGKMTGDSRLTAMANSLRDYAPDKVTERLKSDLMQQAKDLIHAGDQEEKEQEPERPAGEQETSGGTDDTGETTPDGAPADPDAPAPAADGDDSSPDEATTDDRGEDPAAPSTDDPDDLPGHGPGDSDADDAADDAPDEDPPEWTDDPAQDDDATDLPDDRDEDPDDKPGRRSRDSDEDAAPDDPAPAPDDDRVSAGGDADGPDDRADGAGPDTPDPGDSGLHIGPPSQDGQDPYDVGSYVIDDTGTEYQKTDDGWKTTGDQYAPITQDQKDEWNRQMDDALKKLRRGEADSGAPPASRDADSDSDSSASRIWDQYGGRRDQNMQSRTDNAGNLMGQNLQMDQAARSGDQQRRDAQQMRSSAGRDAQQIQSDAARQAAQAQRDQSWSRTIGDAITDGIQQGGEAFSSTLGGAAADQVSRQIFGTRRDTQDSSSGGGGGGDVAATAVGGGARSTGGGGGGAPSGGGGGSPGGGGDVDGSGNGDADNADGAAGDASGGGDGTAGATDDGSTPPDDDFDKTGDSVTITQTGTADDGGDPAAGGGAESAGSSASGGFAAGPQDRVIDASSQLGGRTVTGVTVALRYEAYSIPDAFEILYEGRSLGATGMISRSGVLNGRSAGSASQVTIRTLSHQSNTATKWRWTADVTFHTR